jgi:predicted small lipoprotein YifL
MIHRLLFATTVAAIGVGLAGCSSSGPVSLGPGDVVSQPAAQRAIPHGQVLQSSLSYSLSGSAGSTLAGVCNETFPSEALRQQREQTNYTIPGPQGHPVVAASNEVVSYKSADDATQAYDELRRAINSCPSSYTGPGGVLLSQNHLVSINSGSAPKMLAFAQYLNLPGGPLWEINVYQFDADYLSAIYAFDPTQSTSMSEAQQLASDAYAKLKKLVAR